VPVIWRAGRTFKTQKIQRLLHRSAPDPGADPHVHAYRRSDRTRSTAPGCSTFCPRGLRRGRSTTASTICVRASVGRMGRDANCCDPLTHCGHRCDGFRPTPFPRGRRGQREVNQGQRCNRSARNPRQSGRSAPKGGRWMATRRCRRRTLNQRVVGSNPTAPTIPFKGLRDGRRVLRSGFPRYSPEMP